MSQGKRTSIEYLNDLTNHNKGQGVTVGVTENWPILNEVMIRTKMCNFFGPPCRFREYKDVLFRLKLLEVRFM